MELDSLAFLLVLPGRFYNFVKMDMRMASQVARVAIPLQRLVCLHCAVLLRSYIIVDSITNSDSLDKSFRYSYVATVV
jgi:hypothetical protein